MGRIRNDGGVSAVGFRLPQSYRNPGELAEFRHRRWPDLNIMI